jgi:hypothetical protein
MADVAELPAAFDPASRRLVEIAPIVAETSDPPGWDDVPGDEPDHADAKHSRADSGSEPTDRDVESEVAEAAPVLDFKRDIGEALMQLEADLAQRAAELAEQNSETAVAARHAFQDNVRRLFDVQP